MDGKQVTIFLIVQRMDFFYPDGIISGLWRYILKIQIGHVSSETEYLSIHETQTGANRDRDSWLKLTDFISNYGSVDIKP